MNRRAFHAIVHGRVQGVAFRYYTQQTAQELQLSGWVRNLPDKTVELWAEGEEDSLKQLATWIERGPSHADVTKVDLTWREPIGEQGSFQVKF